MKNKTSYQVPPGHCSKLLSRNLLENSLFFMFLSETIFLSEYFCQPLFLDKSYKVDSQSNELTNKTKTMAS